VLLRRTRPARVGTEA